MIDLQLELINYSSYHPLLFPMSYFPFKQVLPTISLAFHSQALMHGKQIFALMLCHYVASVPAIVLSHVELVTCIY